VSAAPAAIDEALRFERRKSLPEQVADTIVEAIGGGLLAPGQRILEAEVAARFGVSRVPVREAFRMLEVQGILESQPNRGVHVAAFDDAAIDRICEARLAIEALAVRHVVARTAADPAVAATVRAALDRRIAALARAVRLDSAAGINQADIAFHRELCAASANRIVTMLWGAIARHVLIVFGREILAESSYRDLVRQHEALRDAALSGEAGRAVAELDRHIMRLRRHGASAGAA
jgi:DNA-binding GntR family transcriptional regulator